MRYYYDTDGRRVRKDDATATEYYVNGSSGETEAVVKSDESGATHNILGLDNLGQVKRSGSNWAKYYYLKDHLGTIKMTVDGSAAVVGYDDYYPFGMQMDGRCGVGGADPRYKFTGKERDVESQYDYFGARYYDARVGRFLSLDRYASKYPEYSPYSYGGNEPLGHIDVNGDSTSTPVLSLSTFGQSLFGSNSSSTGLERFQGGHVFSSIERAAGSLLSGVEKATGVTLPTLLKDVISGLAFPTVGPAKLLASGEDVLGTGYKGVQGAVEEGTTVYRVYGDAAKPFGKSWTTVDPGTVSNFRSVAGLPDPNTGRFMIEGVLKSTAGVTARQALPFGARSGGLPEVVIPNAKTQVDVLRVMGVNPPF